MAKGYRPVDRDQAFLFPPDMREWLPAGHPVWLVITAVELMDTSAFHAGRKTGGAIQAGHHRAGRDEDRGGCVEGGEPDRGGAAEAGRRGGGGAR
jgi:hypothetical protein